jgi:signal transduction histidine kinase/CheY-like chemotaxis protein
MHFGNKSDLTVTTTGFIPEAAIGFLPVVVPSFYWVLAIGLALAVVVVWRLAQRSHQRTASLQREIAEGKQAQLALRESQEFLLRQERLAGVGQLAAGLAHEFNNILTVVQGHVCLLMDNTGLDDESVKSLNIINDGVERTAKLIKQMLAFSRQQVMKAKPLDVKETLGQTAETLHQILGQQATLQFEIAPRLPAIMADPAMFEQIIINLVGNARDAMACGGQLTIRADEAKFGADGVKSNRKPGRFVRLTVSDTGSGMDTAIINRLFEPFFTTKDVGKGSGLGLATVHGMVEQHQGWIEVDSKIGKGTNFDIYLPIADHAPEKTPVPRAAPLEIRGGKETILVAEDKQELRELVREVLVGRGYHVLEAENGLQALQLWQNSPTKVDLVLTDVAMPHGISGRELAARIWREKPRLPVIFSSGYNQEMVQRTEENGRSVTLLSKPYKPAELAQAVRDALDKALASSDPE